MFSLFYWTSSWFLIEKAANEIAGLYCNHYFLKMLAMIGRGHYDAAYDASKSCTSNLQKWVSLCFLFSLRSWLDIELY